MRVFKSKWFVRFARKERITDAQLLKTVENAEKGLIDADYGGGVIKQRIARPGAGKSGGYRSIVYFRKGERAFFAFGFAKNEQDNIDESDERDFKDLAKVFLSLSETELKKLIDSGKWTEVKYDEEGDEKDDEERDEKDGEQSDE
jgi:hypothetical protein